MNWLITKKAVEEAAESHEDEACRREFLLSQEPIDVRI